MYYSNLSSLLILLGLLQRLNGLSLSGNPLSTPPPNILQKGTLAVLKYLRTMIEEKDERGTNSSGEEGRENVGGVVGVAHFSIIQDIP